MTAPQEPFGWMDASAAYTQRMMRETDAAGRMELLSQVPDYSVWKDTQAALAEGAAEIRRLRALLQEKTDDAA